MGTNKIYTLLFASCLFSCFDKIETATNEEANNGINFLVGAPNSAHTKVSMDGIFATTFGENDVIGIFIYKIGRAHV